MEQSRVISSEVLKEKLPLTFSLQRGGEQVSIIVVRHTGKVYAYENECRHLPIRLDLASPGLLDPSEKFLHCQSHGALYEMHTGLCIDGPCKGAKLKPLHVEEKSGRIFIRWL